MKVFLMKRKGATVAEGVEFSDGRVAIRWQTDDLPRSLVFWDSLSEAYNIHNHDGNTVFEMSDNIAWPSDE